VAESILIEALYWQLRRRGGQRAQLETGFSTDSVAAAFAATVADVHRLRADGPFFPDGTRKSLHTLAQERVDRSDIVDTEHVQTLLWQPTRWQVAEHPSALSGWRVNGRCVRTTRKNHSDPACALPITRLSRAS
jgi:hypothetical protein